MTQMPERKVQRENLCRSVSFIQREAEEGDGLTLDGYGAVFNSPTRIDSWEGCFDESIAPGAFKKSLREQGVPLMQFDHGSHPLIGSIPIGRFESVEEDSHGLHVVGRLTDNWLIQPVRDAIRDGGVTGMSFRFAVMQEEWRDLDGKLIKDDAELWDLFEEGSRTDSSLVVRTLKQVRCTEVGPVVWPAYADTSVGVRSKSITVDLGSRESLARAAFLIDAAVRNTGEVKTDQVKTEDQQRTTNEAVRDSEKHTDTSEAGEHSPDPNGLLARKRRREAMMRDLRGFDKTIRGIRPISEME